MKMLLSVFYIFFLNYGLAQSTNSDLIRSNDFTKAQTAFIKGKFSDAHIYFFKKDNIIIAYTEGYVDIFSREKAYDCETKSYSESEYNFTILFKHEEIGRLILDDSFEPKELTVKTQSGKKKFGFEYLNFEVAEQIKNP